MEYGLSSERGDEGGKAQIEPQNIGPGIGIVDPGEERSDKAVTVERCRVVLEGDLVASATPEIIPLDFRQVPLGIAVDPAQSRVLLVGRVAIINPAGLFCHGW